MFRPIEELPQPGFEIPFYVRARFRSDRNALVEYSERVWCTCTYTSATLCPAHAWCRAGQPMTLADPNRRSMLLLARYPKDVWLFCGFVFVCGIFYWISGTRRPEQTARNDRPGLDSLIHNGWV